MEDLDKKYRKVYIILGLVLFSIMGSIFFLKYGWDGLLLSMLIIGIICQLFCMEKHGGI